jgi:hypothetical protein
MNGSAFMPDAVLTSNTFLFKLEPAKHLGLSLKAGEKQLRSVCMPLWADEQVLCPCTSCTYLIALAMQQAEHRVLIAYAQSQCTAPGQTPFPSNFNVVVDALASDFVGSTLLPDPAGVKPQATATSLSNACTRKRKIILRSL